MPPRRDAGPIQDDRPLASGGVDELACRRSLSRLQGLYLDCGRRDQYNLQFGARRLVRKLETYEIPHRYEEFDDSHSGVDYRLDTSLPFLYKALTSV